MTALEQAIKDAIEKGGYKPQRPALLHETNNYRVGDKSNFVSHCNATPVLDPAFWQALGKARGWKHCYLGEDIYCEQHAVWKENWHRLIDHLASGKDMESFFEGL